MTLTIVLALLTRAPAPPDGHAIIAAMHDRYAGKWYATLTFVQHNTATRPDDSTEHSTWHEYAALPGSGRRRAPARSASTTTGPSARPGSRRRWRSSWTAGNAGSSSTRRSTPEPRSRTRCSIRAAGRGNAPDAARRDHVHAARRRGTALRRADPLGYGNDGAGLPPTR